MPIYMSSFLLPTSPSVPFLLEDINLRGGLQCVSDVAARDAIGAYKKKDGMLVFCSDKGDGTKGFFQWNNTEGEWEEADLGGGGGGTEVNPYDPLYIEPADGSLRIRSNRILPDGGELGQVPSVGEDGEIVWRGIDPSENVGVRTNAEYVCVELQPGEELDFQLTMGKLVLLISCQVNAIDMELKGFTSANRDDLNPYTFVSDPDYTKEEGVVKKGDGTIEYRRRHTILSNTEATVSDQIYFTARNVGGVPATATYSFVFTALE